MEQHPVPQDVTGFQFKLVGDMTLKQFSYLALGAIFAWVFWSSSWYNFIKIPAAIFSILAGIAFAFLPIQERPLEVWVKNFFKSIYRPTYLVWKKSSEHPDISPLFILPTLVQKLAPTQPLASATPSAPSTPPPPPPSPATPGQNTNPKPALSVDDLLKMREEQDQEKLKASWPKAPPVRAGQNMSPPDVNRLEEIRRQAQKEQQKDQTLRTLDDQEKAMAALASQNDQLTTEIVGLQQQLGTDAEIDKEALNQKLLELAKSRDELQLKIANVQKTLARMRPPSSSKPSPPTPPAPKHLGVTINPSLSLSDIPNVVSGLIKYSPDSHDPGAAIEGAIILVKDNTGTPIRALKTNKIGQFITSTPLENGHYILEVEKPGFKFEVIEFDLTGKILPVLEIFGLPYA